MSLLTSINCCTKNISVLSIVVAELELSNIEWHIFAAHFVERADDTALEDRPEALDGLRMNCANDVLAPSMVHSGMGEVSAKAIVASPLVSAEQTYFMRDSFLNEGFQCGGLNICDNAGDDISLSADCTDDWSFAGTNAASSATAAAFIPMPVLCQSTDESFIDLDNAAELINIFHQSNANLMAHFPCGFVRTEAHIAHDLQCAHAFLAGQHKMDDAIPVTKWLVRVLEDCPGYMGKAIAGFGRALIALPAPRPVNFTAS